MTVKDSNPHFFYMVSNYQYLHNCSFISDYQSSFNVPDSTDVLFALNPVSIPLLPRVFALMEAGTEFLGNI